MGRQQTDIHQDQQGLWWVDKVYKGTRLRHSFEHREEAENWLIFRLEQLRQAHLFGIRPKKTFDEAAAKYHQHQAQKQNSNVADQTDPLFFLILIHSIIP